jgi:hypothetical protein
MRDGLTQLKEKTTEASCCMIAQTKVGTILTDNLMRVEMHWKRVNQRQSLRHEATWKENVKKRSENNITYKIADHLDTQLWNRHKFGTVLLVY